MLVFVEMQVSLGFLVLRTENTVRRCEFGHDQPASAKIANEAPKDGIGDARHGSKYGRRRDLDVADHYLIGHSGARTGEDARACIRRIVPVLLHRAILLPSPSLATVAQFASAY